MPVTPSASHDPERRARTRGRLHLFWDALFGALRLIGRHVRGFYATVGLFLTIGAVLALAGTWAFAFLARHVTAGSTQAFDDIVMKMVGERQSPAVQQAMLEITFLGTGLVVMTIVAVSAMFLWITRHRYSATLLLFATLGAIVLNSLLKAGFDRPRPQVFQWGTHALTSSFPSGHAMSATVVYSTVAYLAARLEAQRLMRWLVITVAALLIILICSSRVYLGVHYPSDILAGILVGLAWAGFCMASFEAFDLLARRAAPTEAAQQELPAPTTETPLPKHDIPLSERQVAKAEADAKKQ
jgi:undecaprenyl-diphosphatase